MNKSEKNLLIHYRKLNRLDKGKCVADAVWILDNPKNLGLPPPLGSLKKQKIKNTQKLKQMAKSIKKITLRG